MKAKQPQSIDWDASTSSTPAKEVELNKSVVARADANKEHFKEEKYVKSRNNTMHKLKEKLFRH